jgi:hypothetical protein
MNPNRNNLGKMLPTCSQLQRAMIPNDRRASPA